LLCFRRKTIPSLALESEGWSDGPQPAVVHIRSSSLHFAITYLCRINHRTTSQAACRNDCVSQVPCSPDRSLYRTQSPIIVFSSIEPVPRSFSSSSSLPRASGLLPFRNLLLQHIQLRQRQHRFLVTSLSARSSMHLRTLARRRSRGGREGVDDIALAFRHERRWPHADRGL